LRVLVICRINQLRFLAECRKGRQNQLSSCYFYMFRCLDLLGCIMYWIAFRYF